MASIRFQYIFDPLCGWCYASSPALAALTQEWPAQLDLLPSGMFSGAGARPMSADWAAYAWSNDQRIATATGEVFSDAYHDQVLLDGSTPFDSTAINLALTAVRQISSELEPTLLRHLQLARYVAGRNTSSAQVVAEVTAAALTDAGHAVGATQLSQRLETDSTLAQQTDARTRSTQQLMSRLGIRGVPQLLAEVDGKLHTIPSAALYQGRDVLLNELHTRFSGALG